MIEIRKILKKTCRVILAGLVILVFVAAMFEVRLGRRSVIGDGSLADIHAWENIVETAVILVVCVLLVGLNHVLGTSKDDRD